MPTRAWRLTFQSRIALSVAIPSFYVRMPFEDIWRRRARIFPFSKIVSPFRIRRICCCCFVSRHCRAALKWICDIAGVVQKYTEIDWERLYARARDLDCLRMLLVGSPWRETLFESRFRTGTLSPLLRQSASLKRKRFLDRAWYSAHTTPHRSVAFWNPTEPDIKPQLIVAERPPAIVRDFVLQGLFHE